MYGNEGEDAKKERRGGNKVEEMDDGKVESRKAGCDFGKWGQVAGWSFDVAK